MKALGWVAALTALALWSLLAWAAHALIDPAVAWIAAGGAALPLDPAWAPWIGDGLGLVASVAGFAVVAVWALGAVVLAVLPLVIGGLARSARDGGPLRDAVRALAARARF